MLLRRLLKLLHTLGSIGMAGGIAAIMLLLATGPDPAASTEYLALREGVFTISHSLVLPSMAMIFLSGVLAMAVHFPFQNALWVWLKLGAGFLIFESMLATLDAPARRAVESTRRAMDGGLSEPELMAAIVNHWGAWWVILTLAALNVVLAIWRPRFKARQNVEATGRDRSETYSKSDA
jgi:hypothetical protein